MSVSFEVTTLEKEASAGNIDVSDRISNLRLMLVVNDKCHITTKEAKIFALHIWNTAVRLQQMMSSMNAEDKASLRLSIIPQIRILTVDIYKKYGDSMDDDDMFNLFYFYVYTYKSLIDADNYDYAEQFADAALNLFPKISNTPSSTQTLVQLKLWQSSLEISRKDYEKAYLILKEFTSQYLVESSLLISFIYEKSIELKSIKWCQLCLSLVQNSTALANEWRGQVQALLAQSYLNQGMPEEAVKIIPEIPISLNSLYLGIKCSILLNPSDPFIGDHLIAFISKTEEDRRVLVALCLFVADNSSKLGEKSIFFIREAMKIDDIKDKMLKKHVWFSAFRIVCEQNDLENTANFLEIFKKDFDTCSGENNEEEKEEVRREIAGIFWNRALDTFDAKEFNAAAKWMQFSRLQMSDLDNSAQSSCFRFICRCMFEAKNYSDALSFANKAIQQQQNNSHGYLLKLRILNESGNEREARDMIRNLLSSSPYLEEFEPSFFTSIAAEFHTLGNMSLALEVLTKFVEMDIEIPLTLKKNAVNSIFSILQQIDDIPLIIKTMAIVAAKWDENMDISSNERAAYAAIAFNAGLNLKKSEKWNKAAKSFMNGALFSGENVEYKAPCIYEYVDCMIKHHKNMNKRALINTYFMDNKNNMLLIQDDIIENIFENKNESINENINESLNENKKENIKENINESINVELSSQLIDAQNALHSITSLVENAPQKYKDGYFLAEIKISLISVPTAEKAIELIEDVTAPSVLCEICDFICEYKTSPDVINGLLERAKKIDTGDFQVAASILHQLAIRTSSLEDLRRCFEMVLDFFRENADSLKSSQLQFFMSRAWNVGVQHIKSLRTKDGEWWLNTALTIMAMNEELNALYSDDLNNRYTKFLEHEKSRIAINF